MDNRDKKGWRCCHPPPTGFIGKLNINEIYQVKAYPWKTSQTSTGVVLLLLLFCFGGRWERHSITLCRRATSKEGLSVGAAEIQVVFQSDGQ